MNQTPTVEQTRTPVWLKIVAGLFVALFPAIAIVEAIHWPFTRAAMSKSLQQTFSGTVEMRDFRRVFFPRPGCILQGVTIRRPGRRHHALFVAIERMAVDGDYFRMLTFSKQLRSIHVSGVKVQIPAHEDPAGSNQQDSGVHGVTVDDLAADQATVEFEPQNAGGKPYVISVDAARLGHAAVHRRFWFETALHLSKPQGQIRVRGWFGPWDGNDPFRIPISGSYSVERMNLAFAEGIAGFLNSTGRFQGPLHRIEVSGSADVPQFEVTHTHHTIPVQANFRVAVNGHNGDAVLDSIDAQLGHTKVQAAGKVADRTPAPGKMVALDMNVLSGRIEDLLHLFESAERPGMTGTVQGHLKAAFPPGVSPFLTALWMDGEFQAGKARFTAPDNREGIDRLSERSRGKKGDEPDPEDVFANLGGKFVVQHGVAKLAGLRFVVPGASADLAGNFNLISTKIDLHGNAHLDVKLSRTQKGAKSFFLKVLDPLFQRRRGSDVPIKVTGAYGHAAVGLDIRE